MRRFPASLVAAFLALLLGSVPALATEGSRFRPPVRSEGGVVATESMPAARVGLGVLDRGGNAIDAAVATVFAIGVSRPQSCGIGGGGFLVYRNDDGHTAALDFREAAPAAFTPRVFQGSGIFEDFSGHRTIGVPGVVDGMWKALHRFGTISWAEAIRPAERLADRGVRVTGSLHRNMADEQERLELFPEAARIYLRKGRPYPVGSTLVQQGYARSLSLIRRNGPGAFYRGRIAHLIIEDMKRSGDLPGDRGLMTLRDLARYEALWRSPLEGAYRDHGIVAMPPPTSGGIAILEMLNILEGFDVASFGHGSADHFHFLAEAQKIAWADRNEYVADPAYARVPTRALISKSYAAKRRKEIKRDRAKKYAPGRLGSPARAGSRDPAGGTTTHISIIDKWGNAVAVTCTIEQSFGSAVVAPGTGFLLNNEMTDFGDPGTANEAEGGKRPRSSMSPTIVVRRGQPVLVTGGAGGSLIIMGVLHSIVNVIDFDMDIAHAVDAQRDDAQLTVTEPGFPLLLEDGRVPQRVERELTERGHDIITLAPTFTAEDEYALLPRVEVAGIDPATGETLGVSDPRTENGTLGQ
jgi:gamma-glutamyltranspeptidase / glutathione hydrolase